MEIRGASSGLNGDGVDVVHPNNALYKILNDLRLAVLRLLKSSSGAEEGWVR